MVTQTWLHETKAKLDEAKATRADLEARIEEVNRFVDHLQAVYTHYAWEVSGPPAEEDFGKYEPLSQRDTLFALMDENDDNLYTGHAAKVFKTKVAKPENAASAVFSMVSRLAKQGLIEKVDRGHYRRVSTLRRVQGLMHNFVEVPASRPATGGAKLARLE